MDLTNVFYEEVTERCGGIVLASKVRKPTLKEIEEALALHSLGKCPHTIVRDKYGWMYDIRSCAICGEGLGTV